MDPSFIIIIALAFGAMWLMSSRTRKQQRAAGDFRANLEVGNEVMTGSGLFGTIVEIDGDTITLESTPGNETRWIRAAIAKIVLPQEVDAAEDEDGDEDDEFLDDEDADTDDYVETEDDADTDDDADDDDDELSAAQPNARAIDPTLDDEFVVPDDLSSLSDPRGEDDTDKK
ncbi:MAG: preprotein translocase subunit YajC [Cellulomonas sp.]